MHKLSLMTALLIALQALPLAGAPLAKVNGKAFTEQDFKKALKSLGSQAEMVKTNPQVRARFLDHVINSRLLYGEAVVHKLDKSPKFQEKLTEARRQILGTLYLDKYVEDETSPAKLKAWFAKNKARFSDKEVRASHILLKEADKAKAETVLKEALKKGADFAALAKKHSTGPSGPKGGDLNFFKQGRMVPAFDKVAFSTAKGKVHPKLVKTQFGWHIIKVTDVKGGGDVKFKDKQDEVKRIRGRELREELVKNLRDKARVTINNDALTKMKLN